MHVKPSLKFIAGYAIAPVNPKSSHVFPCGRPPFIRPHNQFAFRIAKCYRGVVRKVYFEWPDLDHRCFA
jgi:hypothetical protein